MIRWRLPPLVLLLLSWALPAYAAFLGHGGPVTGLAISADAKRMVSVSFDYSVIVWGLVDGAAVEVLKGHRAAVNDVVMLSDGERFVTAGDDGDVLVWRVGSAAPEQRLEGHAGRVVDLAVSPDGRVVASASWDHTIGLWEISSGRLLRRFEEHGGPVSGARFTPDGERLVSVGVDGEVRIWSRADGSLLARLGGGSAVVHALELDPVGRIAYAAASNGAVQRFDLLTGERLSDWEAALPTALFALAVSADGAALAATGLDGTITLWETASGARRLTLGGDRSPLWSLAFAPDGRRLFVGGDDRTIRQWDVLSAIEIDEPVALPATERKTVGNGDAGRIAWRRCVACHTLEPDDGNRAGPTLHKLFGRPIGSVEGYPYSPALAESEIIWTEETVGQLFTLGPDVLTPGTKMPVQRISDPDELAALLAFLRREAMPDR